jgi:hypothetical protein
MAYDALQALRDAGTPVDQLSDEQKAVVASLTPHEVEILTDIQRRVAEAGADVEGQTVVGIGLF